MTTYVCVATWFPLFLLAPFNTGMPLLLCVLDPPSNSYIVYAVLSYPMAEWANRRLEIHAGLDVLG